MTTEIQNYQLSDADVYRSSIGKLLILIPKSPSKNYGLAIKLANKLQSYQCMVDGQNFTICSVELKNLRECELAQNISELASNWKGFAIIFNGQTIPTRLIAYTIFPCIKNANQCSNSKANCLSRAKESTFIKNYGFPGYKELNFEVVVPCKLAQHGFYDPILNIPINEQFQAHAVKTGVSWCPFFDMTALSIIETKHVTSSSDVASKKNNNFSVLSWFRSKK